MPAPAPWCGHARGNTVRVRTTANRTYRTYPDAAMPPDTPIPPTSTLLRQAVQLHQQGRLDQAATLYRQVLTFAPRQFDALHLLGVIERQRGAPARAAELIEAALAIDASQARAHCNLGAALQDLDRPEDALASYDAALRLDPRYALAWDNRGNTLRRLGRPDEALDAYDRALALQPDAPASWCHRAILLNDVGRPADAAFDARRALSLRPAYADALLALGNALQAQDAFGDAIGAYDAALGLEERADLWCARGAALKKAGRPDEALASYDAALRLKPGYALAAHYRANALRALGRDADAIEAYRGALALGANADEIAFALAALGHGDAPGAAPPAYVKDLFDQYAGRFDRHLVDVLGYRTPALLGELLARHGVGAQGRLDVADLGCGTGLCAPVLAPLAKCLVGVDLSARMLEQAGMLGMYDELACDDIAAWLARAPDFDLAVAADVFVYIGDLAIVFARVRAALRAGGRFAFSCETLDDAAPGASAGFILRPSNRYAHTRGYLHALAADAGFDVLALDNAVLRREGNTDVGGQLVLLGVR
jgi:predicted TPR repeat methyltransferase